MDLSFEGRARVHGRARLASVLFSSHVHVHRREVRSALVCAGKFKK